MLIKEWFVSRKISNLWSLHLNPPHTPRAVNYSIFRNYFTGVDLTESSNDTTTGEDHIPTNISWTIKIWYWWKILQCLQFPTGTNYSCTNSVSPLDSITLLSPIFRACDTVSLQLREICHTWVRNKAIYVGKNYNANQNRIPQPTSNTLFMPMVIVCGSIL